MIALDLFAGTGWGVACQRLGIEEYGVEIMPEAVATREANGMTTVYRDVWEGLDFDFGHPSVRDYDLLIASPPCQTFSMAGGGAGRKALDEVLGLIDAKAYRDVEALRRFGDEHDPRTALVLTPLAHVYRDVPTFVVFEQVPPVLPVWGRCAEEMRRWGYSVWTGVLNAEQYGVPQTRRRAILIARADGREAKPPTPTHSRYYSRDPKRLDPGVKPWVSMAEALGWGMTECPFVTAGNAVGRAEGIGGSGGKAAVQREKERGAWALPDEGMRGPWGMTDRPYPTVASGTERGGGTDPLAVGGSGARKIITEARDAGRWVDERGVDRPLLSGGASGSEVWETRPATTIATDGIVAGPGWSAPVKGGVSRQNRPGTERVTVAEAAALQSYPPDFVWCGTKTKQFLQIGNAVPPLLAEAILREVIA